MCDFVCVCCGVRGESRGIHADRRMYRGWIYLRAMLLYPTLTLILPGFIHPTCNPSARGGRIIENRADRLTVLFSILSRIYDSTMSSFDKSDKPLDTTGHSVSTAGSSGAAGLLSAASLKFPKHHPGNQNIQGGQTSPALVQAKSKANSVSLFRDLTPLEAGCICIFECNPTSSECPSCDYCAVRSPPPSPRSVVLSPPSPRAIPANPISDKLISVKPSLRPMVGKAIQVGNFYGQDLQPGRPNKAVGDCLIEVCMDQLNFRPEFEQMRLCERSPQFYRDKWFREIERVAWGTVFSEDYSESEWKAGWKKMRQPRQYEQGLGDMVIAGIAHCNSVDILIFIGPRSDHSLPMSLTH